MTAIEITCPRCRVRPGRRCLTWEEQIAQRMWSYTTTDRPHAERIEAAEAQTRLVREERVR